MAELTGPNTYELTVAEYEELKDSQALVCRMRDALDRLVAWVEKAHVHLPDLLLKANAMEECAAAAEVYHSTAPCPHAAEVERLRAELHEWEESDKARVVLGPTLSEAIDQLAEARRLLRKARGNLGHSTVCGVGRVGGRCDCHMGKLSAELETFAKGGGE